MHRACERLKYQNLSNWKHLRTCRITADHHLFAGWDDGQWESADADNSDDNSGKTEWLMERH